MGIWKQNITHFASTGVASLNMMFWPSIGTGVLNFLLGLSLQLHPHESLYVVAMGTFAGELLVLATWIAWSHQTLISRIGWGYLICATWTLLWWCGFLCTEKSIYFLFVRSEARYAMYSTFIMLTICSTLFGAIRFIGGWRITVGGGDPAIRLSLRGLFICLTFVCVSIAVWPLLVSSRTWAVGIGYVLAMVGVGSCPVNVFAILRSKFRPLLLFVSHVWTLGAVCLFAGALVEDAVVAPDVRSFVLVCFACNVYQIIVVSAWQCDGYRLVLEPVEYVSAPAEAHGDR